MFGKQVTSAKANELIFNVFSSAATRGRLFVDFATLDRSAKIAYVKDLFNTEVFYHQDEPLDVLTDAFTKAVTFNATRQSGKTEVLCWANFLNAAHNLYPALDGTTKMISLANKESQSLIGGHRLRSMMEKNWDKCKFFWDQKGSTKTHLIFKREAGVNSRQMGTIDYLTANPRAFSEGFTASVMLVDEAGRLDPKVWSEVLLPYGGSTAARFILTGVSRGKGPFYDACNDPGYLHLNYPWDKVETYRRAAPVDLIDPITNRVILQTGYYPLDMMPLSIKKALFPNNPICHLLPNSRQKERYVPLWELSSGKMAESDFRSQYCVAPETKVLTADLRYIRADEVTKETKLVGFDEHIPGKGLHRQFKQADVLEVGKIRRPCYRLTLSDGTIVTASAEHQWLVCPGGGGQGTKWKMTEKLLPTDAIYKVAEVWEEARTYESGYLAAAYEGEGSLHSPGPGHWILCFAQNDNVMLSTVKEYLTKFGFSYTQSKNDATSNAMQIRVNGGRAQLIKFLGIIRPKRLLQKFDINKLGSIGRHDRKTGGFTHPTIVKKEFVGEQDVIAMKTSTATFVAEGLASHNCLEWVATLLAVLQLLHLQNMFETSDYDPIYEGEMGETYYFGLDLGGSRNLYATGESNKDCSSLSIFRHRHGKKQKVFCDELYSAQPEEVVRWAQEWVDPHRGRIPCKYGGVDVTATLGALASEHLVKSKLPVIPITYNRTEATTHKNFKNAMFDYAEIEAGAGRVQYPRKEITDGLDPDTLRPLNPIWNRARNQWEIIERELTGGINAKISAPAGEHDDQPNADVMAMFVMDRPQQFEEFLQAFKKRPRAVFGTSMMGSSGFRR